MKISAFLAAAAVLLTATAACGHSPEVPVPSVTATTGLERTTYLYARKDGQDLHLDRLVDTSVEVNGRRPVIIFSYGGGWEMGSRGDEGLTSGLIHLTTLGYEVIAIDYRLGIRIAKERGEFTPETGTQMYLRAIQWGVEDLFDATAFVLDQAEEWNIDTDQIVLMGGSAGATNSLVAEYHLANATDLATERLPEGFRYAGVISMAGAFWLEAGTPLTFRNRPAPIMFFHGARDQLVTYDEIQAHFAGYGPVAYARMFPGPDYPKWFVDYPDGDHIIAAMPMIDETKAIEAFLQRLVRDGQQLSIHTIEHGKVAKVFQNAGQLLAGSGQK